MFQFEELDNLTRRFMIQEFEEEEATMPYRSKRLSPDGVAAFSKLLRESILSGNEETFYAALVNPAYWLPAELYWRAGRPQHRRVNPEHAARSLAFTEFNTWYVRGLAKRLLAEGVETCEIYRAAPAWEPRDECTQHEGRVVPVQLIYNGHRARYWPEPGDPAAFSIPSGTNCHHSIRRVRTQTRTA